MIFLSFGFFFFFATYHKENREIRREKGVGGGWG